MQINGIALWHRLLIEPVLVALLDASWPGAELRVDVEGEWSRCMSCFACMKTKDCRTQQCAAKANTVTCETCDDLPRPSMETLGQRPSFRMVQWKRMYVVFTKQYCEGGEFREGMAGMESGGGGRLVRDDPFSRVRFTSQFFLKNFEHISAMLRSTRRNRNRCQQFLPPTIPGR